MSIEDEMLLKEAKLLPWKDRLLHKNWKVRNDANIDLSAVCSSISDPKDPRLREFGPFFQNTVADSIPQVQDKALDALIVFLRVADADVGRYAKEVCDGIVAKCLTGRPKTVEKAQAISMLWVELEAVDAFLDAMEKAIKAKVAKAIVPAIDVMFQALREFGPEVVPPKRILKLLPELFEHQNQEVRNLSKRVTLELCRWIGEDPVKSILFEKIRDTMKEELEVELANVTGPARPYRKIRSKQDKETDPEAMSAVAGSGPAEETAAGIMLSTPKSLRYHEIDEYELEDPVDILTPLKKSGFWVRVENTKWLERKEAVAELSKLALTKRIAPGDFTEICQTLIKLMADVNISVAVQAIQAIGNLARGLRTNFSGNSRFMLPVLLEKLKEKKPTLIDALTQTLQAMYKFGCLNLADIVEDIKTAVKNKVPHVRSLTLNWLTFCIESGNKANVLKLHKEYVPICMECLNDGKPNVRDAAFSALAAVVKLVGMRPLKRSVVGLDEVRKKKLSKMIRSSGGCPSAAAGSAAVKSSSGAMLCSEAANKKVGSVESGANKIGDGFGPVEAISPCIPQQERQIIQDLTRKSESISKEGDLFFLISNRWITGWKKYAGFGAYSYDEVLPEPHLLNSNAAYRPGPIDNSNIVSSGSSFEGEDLQLLHNLEEQHDYVVVSQDVWEKLFEWYKGGPVLPRKMISVGVQQELVVEVYPLCLKLIDARDESESIIRLSKKASLHELYERVCSLKATEPGKVRVWDYLKNWKHTILEDSTKTLEESNLQMNQSILLEVQVDGILPTSFGMDSTGNESALIPIEPLRPSLTIAGGLTLSNGNSMGYCSSLQQGSSLSSVLTDMEGTSNIVKPVLKGNSGGLAGLQNLGNTCFMNSSLQCLVHTPPLVEYFLQDYTDEINKQNPLGKNGELAVAFGELLRKIWFSRQTSIAPREFKEKLDRFASQFSGYNQHDSQELVAFLLDGLHEDLNRVKQKPCIELKDCDGLPDEEVADKYWTYLKARNDSIIVDVFQGQSKSTLVCGVCKKISIAFDPFMYLSLPLASTATRTMTVSVFYGYGSGLPMPYSVTVLKNGACKDLKLAVASACCLKDDEGLLLAEVYEHTIRRYLEVPSEPLSSIKDNEHIVAYRHPKENSDSTKLEICHRYLDNCSPNNLKGGEWKLFLVPLVSYVKDIEGGADIDLAVNRLLSPFKRKVYVSSTKVFSQKKIGSTSEVCEQSTGNCSGQFGDGDQSMEEVDMEHISRRQLSFSLCITDDMGLSCRPDAKNSPIIPDRLVTVMLDWTEKEHELYDASYLKYLPVVHEMGPAVNKTRLEAISLFSCLDSFLEEEPLRSDDMWYCPNCKKHRQATKKLDLWKLPEILVFHLKRFSYSRYLQNKLHNFVNFPVHDLDLSKYMNTKDAFGQTYVYELYAISNHYGGLDGGHYSAYVKLINEDRWYHFDDSHVSFISEAHIRTSAAYVLFYRRVKVESSGVVEASRSHGVS